MKKFLKKVNINNFIYLLIISICVSQVVKFYTYYQEYSAWQYSDWVINYQGGFIRRGFIGEILFNLYSLTKINLDLIVLFFVTSVIISISYFLIKSQNFLKNSQLNFLIFLSPGFFLYPLMNSEVTGRKDILMILSVAALVFLEKKFTNYFLLLFVIFLIILTALSHSAFIFYMPYILILYYFIIIKRDTKNYKLNLIITISISIICLILVFNSQGNYQQVLEICSSVKDFISEQCSSYGQISWLSENVENYLVENKFFVNSKKSLLIYLISLFLVFLFLSLKLFKSKFSIYKKHLFSNLNPFVVLLILFIFTIPVFILALDWGRYIYLSYSCSFFVFYYCFENKLIISKYSLNLKKFIFVILVCLYSFSWTFPFYSAQNFKFTLSKPVQKILNKLNY